MKLYLIRHGDAVSSSANTNRPLSQLGEEEAKVIKANLNFNNCVFWHSPKLRAKQTAERLAPDAKRIEKAGLCPNSPTEPILNDIFAIAQDTAIVTHLPFVAELLYSLNANEIVPVRFDTLTVVALEGESHSWSYLWNKSPKDFK